MKNHESGVGRSDDLPEYLKVVGGTEPKSGRAVAEANVLVLDPAMQSIYEDSLANFKNNLRAQRPIVLALFTEAGGRMILDRPGKEPVEAPSVPIQYQLYKSVSHSGMALYQLVSPHVGNPADQSWQGPMRTFRVQNQTALTSLKEVDLQPGHREVLEGILRQNLAFMDRCLEKGGYTCEDMQEFARGLLPSFQHTINWATEYQVGHWMDVVAGWKKELGADWDKTYAATNALYVARQNNILYSVLAQFMGQKAIGERLLLIETTAFVSTPEEVFDVLARIVSDRTLGQVFFKDYYLMDAELLGGGARRAIAAEAKKHGIEPLLPPLAPFHSNAWPWRTDPKSGTGTSFLGEAK